MQYGAFCSYWLSLLITGIPYGCNPVNGLAHIKQFLTSPLKNERDAEANQNQNLAPFKAAHQEAADSLNVHHALPISYRQAQPPLVLGSAPDIGPTPLPLILGSAPIPLSNIGLNSHPLHPLILAQGTHWRAAIDY